MLEYAHFINKDRKDAYTYLERALNAANTKEYCSMQKGEIEYWIAYMLDNGLGREKDIKEAYRHYSISSGLGFEKAKEELKTFKKTIFGWKKIQKEFVYLYDKETIIKREEQRDVKKINKNNVFQIFNKMGLSELWM